MFSARPLVVAVWPADSSSSDPPLSGLPAALWSSPFQPAFPLLPGCWARSGWARLIHTSKASTFCSIVSRRKILGRLDSVARQSSDLNRSSKTHAIVLLPKKASPASWVFGIRALRSNQGVLGSYRPKYAQKARHWGRHCVHCLPMARARVASPLP